MHVRRSARSPMASGRPTPEEAARNRPALTRPSSGPSANVGPGYPFGGGR
jgi:hypothetical protein